MADIAGFTAFLRTYAGITTDALPDDSPYLVDAFNVAIDTVIDYYQSPPTLYDNAVYNLGTDYLLNWCPDDPPSTFFTDYRTSANLTGFVPGFVSSTADESTSSSYQIPEFAAQLQMSDLQNMRTPFGRAYMAFAQKWGPSIWGVS